MKTKHKIDCILEVEIEAESLPKSIDLIRETVECGHIEITNIKKIDSKVVEDGND